MYILYIQKIHICKSNDNFLTKSIILLFLECLYLKEK